MIANTAFVVLAALSPRYPPFVRLVRWAGAPFRYHLVGLDNIASGGPAIFVANHWGSTGPIAMMLWMPLRLYPWVIREMTDSQQAPLYLYDDFVHPAWHLSGRSGMAVATVVGRIAANLLNSLHSIPVDSSRGWSVEAFRRSLELLRQGQNLLIFPEDSAGPADPQTQIRPFQCGFIGLCRLYEQASGQRLPLYPTAVHPGSKTITVGRALYFDPNGNRHFGTQALCERLHAEVEALYRASQPPAPEAPPP